MPFRSRVCRRQGACVGCTRSKRRCDQVRPVCSQCRKRGQACELRTFKEWKAKIQIQSPSTPSSSPTVTPDVDSTIRQNGPYASNMPYPIQTCNSTCEDPISQAVDDTLGISKELPPLSRLNQASSDPPESSSLADKISLSTAHLPSPCIYPGNLTGNDPQDNTSNDYSEECDGFIVPTTTTDAVSFQPSLLLVPELLAPLSLEATRSPMHNLLWSYFVHRGTYLFQCWDQDEIGPTQGQANPYQMILASMATNFPPLRLAALGLSSFLYSIDTKRSMFATQASKLWQKAAEALCAARLGHLEDSRSLVETIATATLLQLFDTQGDTNVLMLARSAAACMLSSQAGNRIDESTEVVLQMFRWIDICARCSLASFQLPDSRVYRALEFGGTELETNLTKKFSSWVIHPLYTFSYRWINPLLDLGRLIRERKTIQGTNPEDVEAWEEQVDKLEEDLLTARITDLGAWEIGAWEHPDLLNLNEAMYSAVVLLFYSRLRDMVWANDLIRGHVANICTRLSTIGSRSKALNNVVFPLYTAGCEAIDLSAREKLVTLLQRLHTTGYWFNQQSRLVASLLHVWDTRDKNPGATWLEWSDKVSPSAVNIIPV